MFTQKHLLKGYYSWEIVNPDGSVASKSKEKNNLILNQGLNYVESRSFTDLFLYCAIGLGTTAPLLGDTGLSIETKRTGLIQSARSFVSADSYNIRRVFDFTQETETVYYGELGWSPFETPGNNLFSKSQMVDQNGNIGPIQVNRLQFLRVTYTLVVTFSPGVSTGGAPFIDGWNTVGNASFQYVGLRSLSSTGVSGFFDGALTTSEPWNDQFDVFISSGTQALSGLGTGAVYTNSWPQRAIALPYESGSFTKIFYATFGRNSGVGNFSTIGYGVTGNAPARPVFVHIMNSPQFKASNYELTIYFANQWGRA